MPREDTIPRPPLTRQSVLRAAVSLADREGLGALTMRRLGAELGVEAMSLYKHIANKEEILDGIVELVVGEIHVPDGESEWKEAMRRRAASARLVLGRHSWAIGLLESGRSMGPAALRYVNAIIASLRTAGFSLEYAAHAFWILDSFVYGHVIQEASMPFGTSEEMVESALAAPHQETSGEYPHLAELAEHAMTHQYSVDDEFEYGLNLILDALDRNSPSGSG